MRENASIKRANVTYRHIRNGVAQPIFQLNLLGRWLARNVGGLRIPLLTGYWSDHATYHNLVTNAGRAGVASRINGAGSEAVFTYIAIGIGATAANVTDTTLQSEITTNGGQRAVATTIDRTTVDTTNDGARLIITFTFTGSFAVTEAGVLNAASSGTLLARQVFAAVNVVSGDSLQITWVFDVD